MLPAQPTSTSSLYHSHEERKQCTSKTPKRRAVKEAINHAYAAAILSGEKGNS
jgi:hypothetical protein